MTFKKSDVLAILLILLVIFSLTVYFSYQMGYEAGSNEIVLPSSLTPAPDTGVTEPGMREPDTGSSQDMPREMPETRELILPGGDAQTPPSEDQVMCTMDAKICPDGSSVGREGPNCEFAACPTQ